MGELDEDELRLLAEAEGPSPVLSEPVAVIDGDEVVEPPAVLAEPELPRVIAKGPGRRRRQELPEEPQVAAAEPALPDEGNSTVPPAQMDYGDPWGRLPAQMRHFTDGRPAV